VSFYIALFRGINVVGKNPLPMKELVAVLGTLGCEDVTTYIQSGNAVFRHPDRDPSRLAGKIRSAIGASRGFEPAVLLLTVDRLERTVDANPFPEAETDPSKLHVFFLVGIPDDPDFEALEAAKASTERYVLDEDVVYLHAPDGIGRSKLAARLEKALGVAATGRNWRTVGKVLEMARGA
jgi:uncharacterized protein (DUF1697 family)